MRPRSLTLVLVAALCASQAACRLSSSHTFTSAADLDAAAGGEMSEWVQLFSDGGFNQRYSPQAAVLDTAGGQPTILLTGGANQREYLPTTYEYMPGDPSFEPVTDNGPVWNPRILFSMLYFKDRLFVMGGMLQNNSVVNDVWSAQTLEARAMTWTRSKDAQWAPRKGQQAVAHIVSGNEIMFVMGGKTPTSLLSDVYRWSGEGEWVLAATNAWPPRWGFGAASFGSKMYISGGSGADGELFSDVWTSSFGIAWSQSGQLAEGRWGHIMITVLNYMFIISGAQQLPTANSTTLFTADGISWQSADTPLALTQRAFAAALLLGQGLYVMGGETLGKTPSYLGDVYLWQPCEAVANCSQFGGRATCMLTPSLAPTCSCLPGFRPPDCSGFTPIGPGHHPPTNHNGWIVIVVLCSFVILMLAAVVVLARRRLQKTEKEMVQQDLTDDRLISARRLKIDPTPIAAGGFAQVYKARFQGSLVAVKQIHGYLMATKDREQLYMKRFRSEAVMMSKLHHPNCQGLLGVCLEPRLCLVTEFAPFGSLADILDDVERLDDVTVDVLLKIVFQIAAGMHFLHTRRPKITHRDLNTNNVLVYSLNYDTLNVKVADFGLSREMVKDTTMTGYLGSPSYIAPEILTDSAQYDEKVDVYSYGIILWAAVKFLSILDLGVMPSKESHRSMMSPYPGKSPWEIVARVKEGMRPEEPRCEAAPILLELMRECWTHRPSERPTFDAVLDRLEEEDDRLHRPQAEADDNTFKEPVVPRPREPGMSKVIDKLYVGGLLGVRDSNGLRRKRITHILNVGGNVNGTRHSKKLVVKSLPMEDDTEYNLLGQLPEAVEFIEAGRRAGCVFVHCQAGRSRSVVAVAAYMMIAYNLRSDAALEVVRRKHSAADPNPGFIAQLASLDDPSHPVRVKLLQAYQRATGGAEPLPLRGVASQGSTPRKRSKGSKGLLYEPPDVVRSSSFSESKASASNPIGGRSPRRHRRGNTSGPDLASKGRSVSALTSLVAKSPRRKSRPKVEKSRSRSRLQRSRETSGERKSGRHKPVTPLAAAASLLSGSLPRRRKSEFRADATVPLLEGSSESKAHDSGTFSSARGSGTGSGTAAASAAIPVRTPSSSRKPKRIHRQRSGSQGSVASSASGTLIPMGQVRSSQRRSSRACSQCNKAVEVAQRYCTRCGHKLR